MTRRTIVLGSFFLFLISANDCHAQEGLNGPVIDIRKPIVNEDVSKSDRDIYLAWERFQDAKITAVVVELGTLGGIGKETTFSVTVRDRKHLALFEAGLYCALVEPPKSEKWGVGLAPNGRLTIKTEKGEDFTLVFHLYPSHDAKIDKDRKGPPMVPGFGFQTIGPSSGGLQTVYSQGWAMFLNEVFPSHGQPKLSQDAFDLLSGKKHLEAAAVVRDELLKKQPK